MRSLILIVTTSFLFGCSGMQFDQTAHEQGAKAKVSAKVIKQNCRTPTVVASQLDQLYWQLDTMNEYQVHLGDNPQLEDAISNTQLMIAITGNMYSKGTPTESYCKVKTDLIIESLDSILEITGRKQ